MGGPLSSPVPSKDATELSDRIPGPPPASSPSSSPRIIDPTRLTDNIIHPLAGATAGFVSGVFTCPLDVVKTKLQAQGGWMRAQRRAAAMGGSTANPDGKVVLQYRGFIGTSRRILSEEGIRGMYRGLGPLVMGYLPTWMVYFGVYENSKLYFNHVFGEDNKHYPTNVMSSVVAGGCSTICTNPIWVIKTRLMSQASSKSANPDSPYHYRNTLDAAKKMYLHEGIRSFYSGLAPALLGLTHVAVQFPLYEYFKSVFTGGMELGQQDEGGKTHYAGILLASCLSKVCASSATYPHEVLRTRLQTQRILNEHTAKSGLTRDSSFPRYRGILSSVATIYREEGWRAFYAGMGTNMIRAVPSSAMTLLTYELVVGYLRGWREQGKSALYEHHP